MIPDARGLACRNSTSHFNVTKKKVKKLVEIHY